MRFDIGIDLFLQSVWCELPVHPRLPRLFECFAFRVGDGLDKAFTDFHAFFTIHLEKKRGESEGRARLTMANQRRERERLLRAVRRRGPECIA